MKMECIPIKFTIVIFLLISCFLNFAFAEKEDKTIFSKTTIMSQDGKTPPGISLEINNLKNEVGHLKDIQENIYNSTITRLNWEFNVIIFAIALIGIIMAVFGIKIVRKYLDESIKNKISELTDMKIEKVVNDRIIKEWSDKYHKLYNDYDKKFSDKYNEFSRIVDSKKKL
jgi:hypothetical protein